MTAADSLPDSLSDLEKLLTAGLAAFESASTAEAVEAARVEYLGQKQGRMKTAQERLRSLEPEGKRVYGQRFNAAKIELEAAFAVAKSRVAPRAEGEAALDVTLPGVKPRQGHLHPLTQTADELIDLFARLGFSVARGPEVEDVYHNFDALNIPPSHPARDPLDNFYLSVGAAAAPYREGDPPGRTGESLSHRDRAEPRPPAEPAVAMLRSQTSTVQIRVMEAQPPPIRVIAIGRVYRPDTVDATHSFMFHQIEGLMVDRGVTMAHLKSVLRLFAQSYLGSEVQIRFRPSFFPFTEPSVEVDMLWHGGDRWVEMGGAGMVDPNVLRSVGYDPEEVTGFAFGLGIERLCMRRHQIDDIRLLYQNDVRFLRQF
jgi:phenylalanyl-tRNA synthetase alpha chain